MRYNGNMALAIDTLKASDILKDAGFKKAEREALINALAPSSDILVTNDKLDAANSRLKAELIMWMVGLHLASITAVISILG